MVDILSTTEQAHQLPGTANAETIGLEMLIPCPSCGRRLRPLQDAGMWFRFDCPMDGPGYISIEDYQKWKQLGGKKFQEHSARNLSFGR